MLKTEHLISVVACGLLEDTAMESSHIELAIFKIFQLIGRKLPHFKDINILELIKKQELVFSTITNDIEKLHLSPVGEDYLMNFLNNSLPTYTDNSGNDEFWIELSIHYKFFHVLDNENKIISGKRYKDIVYDRLMWLDQHKDYEHYKEEHEILQSRIIWLEDIIREHTDDELFIS